MAGRIYDSYDILYSHIKSRGCNDHTSCERCPAGKAEHRPHSVRTGAGHPKPGGGSKCPGWNRG